MTLREKILAMTEECPQPEKETLGGLFAGAVRNAGFNEARRRAAALAKEQDATVKIMAVAIEALFDSVSEDDLREFAGTAETSMLLRALRRARS